MKQRGRKQLEAVAPVLSIPRCPPPADLSEYEAHVWATVVNTKPADWFTADTLPLLNSYVKHVSQARLLDNEIASFDPKWLRDDEGLKRYKVLTDMRDRESRAMTSLARSMRLTHQSRYVPHTAARVAEKGGGKKPWDAV